MAAAVVKEAQDKGIISGSMCISLQFKNIKLDYNLRKVSLEEFTASPEKYRTLIETVDKKQHDRMVKGGLLAPPDLPDREAQPKRGVKRTASDVLKRPSKR